MKLKKIKNLKKSQKFLNDEIKKIFKNELKINVKEKSKIYDFVSWDSVGNFNLLLAFEKNFKIRFTTKEFTQLNSFKEIKKTIQKKNNGRKAK